MTRSRERIQLIALLAVFVPSTFACTHTVGWDPIRYETPISPKMRAKASLYIDADLKTATYSFRAAGSGVANKWVVPYGERVHDFARSYLSQAYTEFAEADSPTISKGVLVSITGVEYSVSGQAAHITVSVDVSGANGRKLMTESYRADGPSGAGAVFGGGVFAQKATVRRSTNRALHEIFEQLLEDLRGAVQ
jgi:hypothetical protein